MNFRNNSRRNKNGRIIAATTEYRLNDKGRNDHDEQKAGISDI